MGIVRIIGCQSGYRLVRSRAVGYRVSGQCEREWYWKSGTERTEVVWPFEDDVAVNDLAANGRAYA